MNQRYVTVEGQAQEEFVEKRSRFIGTIAPITTEQEAVDRVAALRDRYKDATHNVYAYLLRDGHTMRCSDDGEPQGTAGKPVLEVLLREGLSDVVVVVTRYFGGVLLGAGGLTRAYAQAAKCAVDAATRRNICPAARVELDISYDFYGKLTHLLPDYGVVVEDTVFAEGIRLTLLLQAEQLEPFSQALQEISAGVVQPLLLEQLGAQFDHPREENAKSF
ncbi:MAG: YigZ family protein [Angelakisella sp.]